MLHLKNLNANHRIFISCLLYLYKKELLSEIDVKVYLIAKKILSMLKNDLIVMCSLSDRKKSSLRIY